MKARDLKERDLALEVEKSFVNNKMLKQENLRLS
jgi:hypothetical protein